MARLVAALRARDQSLGLVVTEANVAQKISPEPR
jgi:hypothetical protein